MAEKMPLDQLAFGRESMGEWQKPVSYEGFLREGCAEKGCREDEEKG